MYAPSRSKGQADVTWPASHRPTNPPSSMPGASARNSSQRTSRRLRPPISSDASMSITSASGTTSASGQRQASSGTAMSDEANPVRPSTT